MARATMGDHAEEQAWVAAWQAGDTAAMGLLYQRYAPALRAYCAHRLAGNAADAEDAVHDTFLKAQAGLAGFAADARIWPWLATIAANVCSDAIRRRVRGIHLDVEVPVHHDVDEQVTSRVRSAIVNDALRDLPPRYRMPLYLRHFVGSTYEEIARIQGKSVASVRSALMRGRRHLGHRVEAIARSERQWPLPSLLPDITQRARDRLRRARDTAELLLRTAQPFFALEMGRLAPGGALFQAGVIGAAGVAGALSPLSAPAAGVTAAAAAPVSPSSPSGVGATVSLWLPVPTGTVPGPLGPPPDIQRRIAVGDDLGLPAYPYVEFTSNGRGLAIGARVMVVLDLPAAGADRGHPSGAGFSTPCDSTYTTATLPCPTYTEVIQQVGKPS